MDEALRAELLAMRAEDQAMRRGVAANITRWDPQVDRRHTTRLRAILSEHGYPGKSLVGEDGASAAWLIAQHSDHDRDFQREFLARMAVAVNSGEADPSNYAYLTDRVFLATGKSQVYGTQFQQEGDSITLLPVEDPQRLDERRHSVGLQDETEYLMFALVLPRIRQTFQIPNQTVTRTETSPGMWRLVVSGDGIRVWVDIEWDAQHQRCRLVKGPERES